jgi:hypothetical protein
VAAVSPSTGTSGSCPMTLPSRPSSRSGSCSPVPCSGWCAISRRTGPLVWATSNLSRARTTRHISSKSAVGPPSVSATGRPPSSGRPTQSAPVCVRPA